MQKDNSTLQLSFSEKKFECGCDEAGRGCLAGPVVAAAVILPSNFKCPQLNDSKQLTEKERDALRPIIESQALAWAVARVEHDEIDQINILNASILAMHKAISKLLIIPEFIIIDGNRFKSYNNIPHQTIVKGDSLYLSIAAASVLAKTHRDEIMHELDKEYPNFGWGKNKAYPTLQHRKAIREFGVTPYHRISFDLLGDKKVALQAAKIERQIKKSQTLKRITNRDVKG